MITVSLTTFIDFVSATGTARLTRVRQAKKQYEEGWDPARDFYKPLRDRIHRCVKDGWSPEEFKKLLADITDPKKIVNYEACRKGLVKWAKSGNKTLALFPSGGKAVWTSGDLEIRVNPELVVREDDQRSIVKLYFKSDPLSQQKTRLITYLLELAVPGKADVGVLDVRRGKLLTPTTALDGLDALLTAEAVAFTVIWDGL